MLSTAAWGHLQDGRAITRYTLANARGARVSFMPLGATILSLEVPDRAGRLADVVLGFDSAADYNTANAAYIGLTIGRYASRIFGTTLRIGADSFQLAAAPQRDGGPGNVVLHGGPDGFGARVWSVEEIGSGTGKGLRFTLESPDGDQGFPGAVSAAVTYHWSDDCVLSVEYSATTTRPTVINLTQHSYFNLAGAGHGDILGHTLKIEAEHITFATPDHRPTGELRAVRGTPFDFTAAKPIGRDIAANDPHLRAQRGYDINFALRNSSGQLAEAAVLHDPVSGRMLTVSTTEPGLVVYTGNFLDTTRRMKGGLTYPQWGGIALETGHFPDSPNHPQFPSTLLVPGATYTSRTVFAFSAR